MKTTQLQFLGASGMVTGSKYLLKTGSQQYLIDCGLFQGSSEIKAHNWDPFPIPPSEIDAVLLTHAHIDHSGWLPRLVKEGFHGSVYTTEATCALLNIMLPDSANLQEQDAAYANKKGFSRHKPALPLYTVEDAERALKLLKPVHFGKRLTLKEAHFTWRPAGHILGSGMIMTDFETENGARRLLFSGDIGRYDTAFMAAPTEFQVADYLLVETTYGNRSHSDIDVQDALEPLIHEIIDEGGVLVVPAFAVGRTQEMLYHLHEMQEAGRVPDLPIYVDSPMAIDASSLYRQFSEDHNLRVDLLDDPEGGPLRCRHVKYVREVSASKRLNHQPGPAIILSASGMCTGGRILHHLKQRLPDARNTVLFVGFQAEGTLGRELLEGASEVTIHGEPVQVRAKIRVVNALSAHADREDLMHWLSRFRSAPRKTFLVHGEPAAREAFQAHVRETLGWETTSPELGQEFDLD
ncbi:MAG: MBL fold metallo-hydrolase [Fimbriimonadia bacterium]|nr:MBL fold metallo-hydrolase [Fimbriimonadia bacterium]